MSPIPSRATSPSPPEPAQAHGPSHISLRNVGLERNGRWLFRGLTLEIPKGRFFAIVGSSGVGKSSLLQCIAGIIPPTEGEICYCGEEKHETAKPDNPGRKGGHDYCRLLSRRKIGMVFQDLALVSNASLLTNVLCGRLGSYPWWRTLFRFQRQDRIEAQQVLNDLGVGQLSGCLTGSVSGGERQRVAVARALFQKPELYLADEPVSNLDSYYAGRVLGLLRQECERASRTVLCVLHHAPQVERFADYVLSLNPMNPEGWHLRTAHREAP